MLQRVKKSFVALEPFELQLAVDLCEILIFFGDLHGSKASCPGRLPRLRNWRAGIFDVIAHFGEFV